MPISLSAEARALALASFQRFFERELDLEIGSLQADLVLDFVLEEIGPSVYNQALRDVQARLHDVVRDLDASLAKTEFGHTARLRTARNALR